jgi:hypothetical protein
VVHYQSKYAQVYFDFMRSFRTEFEDLFAEGLISAVEIGLGASGELKYPSFSERMGWRYPGIGEFQVSIKPNYPLDAYTHTCIRAYVHASIPSLLCAFPPW